jgi:signal transduction histidine kinase
MSLNAWLKPPGRRLLVLFFATTSVLIASLAWMSWRLVRQDSALVGQRIQELRESAADLAVAGLQKSISQVEEQLTALTAASAAEQARNAARIADGLPLDCALFVIRSGRLEALPAGRLLFYPDAAHPTTDSPAGFSAAEALEFREDYTGAIAALRQYADSRDRAVRAEALMRLGRCLWKSGHPVEALAAYGRLEQLQGVSVAGLPPQVVAREARLLILENQKDQFELRREASAFRDGLKAGAWRLDRAGYEFYLREAAQRLGTAAPEPAGDTPLSVASEQIWEQWQDTRGRGASSNGHRICWQQDQPMLLLWKGSAETAVALALSRTYLESQWLKPLQAALDKRNARISLADSEGRRAAGAAPAAGVQQTVRLASSTGLPWTLSAVSIAGSTPAGVATRQRLILTGLTTLFLLVLAGSYFISRAAAREIAVARLQSDFVASISHEFRTPITALRQLTELLAGGRVASEEDRQEYYGALARESERLHRLVEGLLNFGRFEAGAMRLSFEPLDAAEFLTALVCEFEKGAEARGRKIELVTGGTAPRVLADRAALGCVVWNLLDNAVKYSPECPTVWVGLQRDRGRAAIEVRDCGIGIPREEQRRIFQKFVRGTAAKEAAIQGAGVGLALARQIVEAHGGEIALESRPGEGSVFTILLPEVSRS